MAMPQKVDEESIARAKRARTKLIVIIIVIILALAGVIAAFVYLQKPAVEGSKTETNDTQIDVTQDSTLSAQPGATVPALTTYYGLTPDEVVTAYGSGAKLSGTAPTTDEANPLIAQLSTIQLTDKDDESAGTLYLSLTAEGSVIDIYYSVPLSTLGNNETTFSDLLADTGFFSGVLADAGVATPGNDFPLPAAADYQTLGADGTTVTKESYRYVGTTSLEAPANWELTLTFDHAATVQSAAATSTDRMLYLRLY